MARIEADFRSSEREELEERATEEAVVVADNPELLKSIADRDRLISKGRNVLNLCVEHNKLLCVEGFVDSQVERGGVYLDVVRAMHQYIDEQLGVVEDKKQKAMLVTLQQYVRERLPQH